ncbi:MAG: tRNA (adenosine(37)-N6)-dimethylallyltransferase MiaA [Bacteroides sp.]|nr:tRNA (adenosine(37)-N6)-dimethylallyltransferase MiaA [Bacteroides sp.]
MITGPTASGKSALAVNLAKRLDTEIISADSRQIYQDIPIVTAQPTETERQGITHHLMGHLGFHDYYSASIFEQDALRISSELFRKTGHAIVCGGSMMYVDALCYGIDELPTVPQQLRNSLSALHNRKGDDWLLSRLSIIDPNTFRTIDRKNIKRVFHALEISLTARKPYSQLLTGRKLQRPFRIVKIVLTAEREILFDRINHRVEKMMDSGLLDEARNVAPLEGINPLNTIGLKELFAHFRGKMSLDEAIARIQKNTRVFAKKQVTWLSRPIHSDSNIGTLRLDITDEDLISKILQFL